MMFDAAMFDGIGQAVDLPGRSARSAADCASAGTSPAGAGRRPPLASVAAARQADPRFAVSASHLIGPPPIQRVGGSGKQKTAAKISAADPGVGVGGPQRKNEGRVGG